MATHCCECGYELTDPTLAAWKDGIICGLRAATTVEIDGMDWYSPRSEAVADYRKAIIAAAEKRHDADDHPITIAVRSHDALVAALTKFIEHFGPIEDNEMLHEDARECFRLARTAIELAKTQ